MSEIKNDLKLECITQEGVQNREIFRSRIHKKQIDKEKNDKKKSEQRGRRVVKNSSEYLS